MHKLWEILVYRDLWTILLRNIPFKASYTFPTGKYNVLMKTFIVWCMHSQKYVTMNILFYFKCKSLSVDHHDKDLWSVLGSGLHVPITAIDFDLQNHTLLNNLILTVFIKVSDVDRLSLSQKKLLNRIKLAKHCYSYCIVSLVSEM